MRVRLAGTPLSVPIRESTSALAKLVTVVEEGTLFAVPVRVSDSPLAVPVRLTANSLPLEPDEEPHVNPELTILSPLEGETFLTSVPLEGTARGHGTEIMALTYELSVNGGAYSEPVPLSVPLHAAGDLFAWATELPNLEPGEYTVRVTATDALAGSTTTEQAFTVREDTPDLVEITGITSWESPGTEGGVPDRAGWRFTPDADLLVTHLRVYRAGAQTLPERLLLHETTTGEILAEALDVNDVEGWHESELDEPVQLTRGTEYTISSARADGFGRIVTFNPTGLVMHEVITLVRSVYGPPNDTMPTTEFDPPDAEWAQDYMFVDIRALMSP